MARDATSVNVEARETIDPLMPHLPPHDFQRLSGIQTAPIIFGLLISVNGCGRPRAAIDAVVRAASRTQGIRAQQNRIDQDAVGGPTLTKTAFANIVPGRLRFRGRVIATLGGDRPRDIETATRSGSRIPPLVTGPTGDRRGDAGIRDDRRR